jgi:hypothetical protein
MKRFLATFSLLGLMISGSGCCHSLCGGGCAPPPCGPCGSNYGGYPAYSQAYVQPAYATAAIPTTGFATMSAAACDCNTGVAPISPY